MGDIIFSMMDKKKNELFAISLCVILFISRTAIPFLKYPFLVLYMILGIYILIFYKHRILAELKKIGYNFTIIFALFLYVLLSCIFSDKIYLMIVKDIFNILVLFSTVFILKILSCDTKDFKFFLNSFVYLTIVFAVIISIQKIYYFLYVSSYYNLRIHRNDAAVDYNFALLPVFFGMIGILYLFIHKSSKFKILIYNLLLFLFSLIILPSGSKRGILLFVIFLLIIFLIQFAGLLVNNSKISSIRKNTMWYFYSYSLFVLFMILIIPNTSVYFKNNILEKVGVKSIAHTKILITSSVYRYIHTFDKELTLNSVYQKIWHPVFDSKDPDAWWGDGNYKVVKNLSGRKVEMVPSGSKGYLLDSACLGMASPYHAYYFLRLRQDSVEEGDSVVVSVYCFVSENFNGGGAAIRAEGSVKGNPDKFCDLNNKGCWQKLVLPLNCLNGNIVIYLYINKAGVANFSTLEGSVCFAYPEYRIVSRKNKVSNISEQINDLNRSNSKKSLYDESNLKMRFTPGLSEKLNKSSFLNLHLSKHFSEIADNTEHDPIRKWIAKIVSEDTTYKGYKTNLSVGNATNDFGEDRIVRWKFALEIFNKEYNWQQKMFGGGFNFLNWYGYFFLKDKTKSDYPHNPFLYILLYSGIVGLLLYILLLYKIFYYYIKYIKEYYLFFIFFLITFFFTFFSGGNPFDPPIMGFFVMLPFFIHYVHKKDLILNEKLNSVNGQNPDHRSQ